MLTAYRAVHDQLQPVELSRLPQAEWPEMAWIDAVDPGPDEDRALEAALGLAIPTREDMAEIEVSSRLYEESGAAYMTASIVAHTERDEPILAPITFIVTSRQLITVRYSEPRSFQQFQARAAKGAADCSTGPAVLVHLLEAVVDRLADILERVGSEVDAISRDVFHQRSRKADRRSLDLQNQLRQLGIKGDVTGKVQDSLASLQRLVGYYRQFAGQRLMDSALREMVETLQNDIASLKDHASSLFEKLYFLLDATLGLINIQQNGIIKIFSVAAVVFLPPTLVASIYGMNFRVLPELEWRFGYPLALGLMVVSAILPYLYFRRRGWL